MKKIQDHLIVGRNGHIDVKICANPQPELFWILPKGQIIQPGQSKSRFSASTIWHEVARPSEPDSPSEKLPYCYQNRLIIGNVNQEDKEIFLIVRNEGETRTVNLQLRVKSSASKPSTIACLVFMAVYILFNKYE